MRPARLLLLALCLAASSAQAQTSARGYAPDDLSVLRESDRIRVISREYEDQSGGRRISEDQLEFYLDQVDAGWTTRDIRDDIARSLRQDGRYPSGNAGRVIRCESVDQRRRECQTGFRTRAVIAQQLSRTECVEGRNWGQAAGRVWVDRGCRAEFAEGRRRDYDPDYSITCASEDGRYSTCRWDERRGRPQLGERLSRSE